MLLALEDGSALSRKVLVMFVVQRLEPHFPQASKTSIGHVVQLLYRASCFKVSKREGDSSLMQLKDEFRTYEALRREHDAQIVQIATEGQFILQFCFIHSNILSLQQRIVIIIQKWYFACLAGLRIAPDQWSALLYGDTCHKSHMQSIIDKLQTPQSFAQSVHELVLALQRTNDPAHLHEVRMHLEQLTNIDPIVETTPSWQELAASLKAVKHVVNGLVDFVQHHGNRKLQETSFITHNYKTSMCRDFATKMICPRGSNCTFAHSDDELETYRAKNRKQHAKQTLLVPTNNSSNINANPLDFTNDQCYNHMSSSNEDISSQRHSKSEKSTNLPPYPLSTMLTNSMTQPAQYEHGIYQKPSTSLISQNSNLKPQSMSTYQPGYESKNHRRSFNLLQNQNHSVSLMNIPPPPPLPQMQKYVKHFLCFFFF